MKPNQKFENAFGPVPASFEGSVQQALRQTKEVKPVKKFSIRTAAMACTMLFCLVAVCMALTHQPEDKVAGTNAVKPVTGAVQPLSENEDIACILSEEYEKIDPNAVSWLLDGEMIVDEKVYHNAERLILTADALYIVSTVSPRWPGQSVVVDSEWINETVTHNGRQMSFLDYVNEGNYAFEVTYYFADIYDDKDNKLAGNDSNSVSLHYGLRDEKGSIPVVLRVRGQFDQQTLAASEALFYVSHQKYGTLPNEYAHMNTEGAQWFLSLAPSEKAKAEEGISKKSQLKTAALREEKETYLVNGSAVLEGIDFRLNQVVRTNDASYFLSGLYPVDEKTIIINGDVNGFVIMDGKETTYADLLAQGYTGYRAGFSNHNAATFSLVDKTGKNQGVGTTVQYGMGGDEKLWTDGTVSAALEGSHAVSLETLPNCIFEQRIWLAKCDQNGEYNAADAQYYTWRVDLANGNTELIPGEGPKPISVEEIADLVMRDSPLSYAFPDYAEMDLTVWEVDQALWLEETVYFGLERVVHSEEAFYVKGRFGVTNAGDLLLTKTGIGEIVTADMVDHGYGLHEVEAIMYELRLADGRVLTPSYTKHDEQADWSDNIGVVFVFEQAVDEQLLRDAVAEVQLEYASFDADFSKQLMYETLSLQPDASEEMAIPQVAPVRHNGVSTDMHIDYIVNHTGEKRAQTVLAGNHLALGAGVKVWPVKEEEIVHGVLKFKVDTVVYTPQDFFVLGTVEAAQAGRQLKVNYNGNYAVLPNINRNYFTALRKLALLSENEKDLTAGNFCITALEWDDTGTRFVLGVFLSDASLEEVQNGTLRLLIQQEIAVGEEIYEPDYTQWDVDLSPDY